MNLLTILPACLLIAIFAIVVILYYTAKRMKAKKVKKDLTYLLFLIQCGLKDPATKRTISFHIDEYRDKQEYQGELYDRCVKLFIEKYK